MLETIKSKMLSKWLWAVLLFSILNTVNTIRNGNDTEDVMHYSCQGGSRGGMYGCYDTSNLTVQEVKDIINNITERKFSLYKAINASNATATKATVLQPILDFQCTQSPILSSLLFLKDVAVNKTMRAAVASLSSKMAEYGAEIGFMKNVFNKFEELNSSSETWNATSEEARYVRRFIRDGLRKGITLDAKNQTILKALKMNISEISTNFSRNIHEHAENLTLNASSLRGMSQKFLNSLPKDAAGNYLVSLNSRHYNDIFYFCEVEWTRKLLFTAWSNRGQLKNNSRLLTELTRLRKEMADILGYRSYVDYETEVLMAKNSTNIRNFLDDLAAKLRPKQRNDTQEYLRVKLQKCNQSNVACSKEMQMWDFNFLINSIKETNYSVHQEVVEQYFPIMTVKDKMFEIFSTLLGLKIEEFNQTTWSDDVTSYQVNDNKTGELLGYFFMDLFRRKGKYSHAAMFPLQPSCIRPNGTRQVPIVALVTNFPKPTKTNHGLLTHSEMKTFFHEFGHVMHVICSKTQLSAFSGTSVETDFVEAPSQMLENWLYEPEILKNISSHYQNHTQLPDDVIKAIIQSEYVGMAYKTMAQVMLAMFDQGLHVNGTEDADKLFRDDAKFYLNVTIPDNAHYAGTFGHVADGYAGQYYSYLWSEVYSADMFVSEFEKYGILNSTTGHKYREKILEKGGTRDAIDLLIDFLGRKPTDDAFLKLKHLK